MYYARIIALTKVIGKVDEDMLVIFYVRGLRDREIAAKLDISGQHVLKKVHEKAKKLHTEKI